MGSKDAEDFPKLEYLLWLLLTKQLRGHLVYLLGGDRGRAVAPVFRDIIPGVGEMRGNIKLHPLQTLPRERVIRVAEVFL